MTITPISAISLLYRLLAALLLGSIVGLELRHMKSPNKFEIEANTGVVRVTRGILQSHT